MRNLEILGEAANKVNHVDNGYFRSHPEVPWQLMRTTRNRMIHDCLPVDPIVVWQTVQNDLPVLKLKSKQSFKVPNRVPLCQSAGACVQ